MHRSALALFLALALCITGFTHTDKRRSPGTPVAAGALVSIYTHWFDSPYEYMFDRGSPRLTVGNRAYGEFQAGISGIMEYGGLGEAAALHLGRPKPGFGDLRAIEKLSGLKIYRNKSTTIRGFSRFNPAIVRWGYLNLIPDPGAAVLGHSCQTLYDRLFARFFRLMAESYQHLERGQRWPTEQRGYLSAMKRKGFDGIDYLRQRFGSALPGYGLSQNGTNLTPQMAIGFWIRRRVDGTAAELWKGLGLLLERYDRAWWNGLRGQAPRRTPGNSKRQQKKAPRHP